MNKYIININRPTNRNTFAILRAWVDNRHLPSQKLVTAYIWYAFMASKNRLRFSQKTVYFGFRQAESLFGRAHGPKIVIGWATRHLPSQKLVTAYIWYTFMASKNRLRFSPKRRFTLFLNRPSQYLRLSKTSAMMQICSVLQQILIGKYLNTFQLLPPSSVFK